MTKEIDRATLLRAQKRDRAACRALVNCYEKSVFALLWRMLRPHGKDGLAEDLVQETFLRVFRALSAFDWDGSARLSTWILTIATRLALNEVRKKTRLEPLSQELVLRVTEHQEQADGLVRQKALMAAVERGIGALRPEFRSVFLLSEYHGLSQQEIATSLEIKPGTVKSRLSRSRSIVRAHLKEFL